MQRKAVLEPGISQITKGNGGERLKEELAGLGGTGHQSCIRGWATPWTRGWRELAAREGRWDSGLSSELSGSRMMTHAAAGDPPGAAPTPCHLHLTRDPSSFSSEYMDIHEKKYKGKKANLKRYSLHPYKINISVGEKQNRTQSCRGAGAAGPPGSGPKQTQDGQPQLLQTEAEGGVSEGDASIWVR